LENIVLDTIDLPNKIKAEEVQQKKAAEKAVNEAAKKAREAKMKKQEAEGKPIKEAAKKMSKAQKRKATKQKAELPGIQEATNRIKAKARKTYTKHQAKKVTKAGKKAREEVSKTPEYLRIVGPNSKKDRKKMRDDAAQKAEEACKRHLLQDPEKKAAKMIELEYGLAKAELRQREDAAAKETAKVARVLQQLVL